MRRIARAACPRAACLHAAVCMCACLRAFAHSNIATSFLVVNSMATSNTRPSFATDISHSPTREIADPWGHPCGDRATAPRRSAPRSSASTATTTPTSPKTRHPLALGTADYFQIFIGSRYKGLQAVNIFPFVQFLYAFFSRCVPSSGNAFLEKNGVIDQDKRSSQAFFLAIFSPVGSPFCDGLFQEKGFSAGFEFAILPPVGEGECNSPTHVV